MPTPPDLLSMGAREAIIALQREELRLSTRLRRAHDERFRSYRELMRRAFLGAFVFVPGKTPDAPARQVWDPLTAYRDDLATRVQAQLVATTAESLEDDEVLFEDALDDAFVTGYHRELWLLTLGGLPGGQYAPLLPEDTLRRGLLLAAGVAGLNWLQRLRRWGDWHVGRTSRWVQAAMVGEQTLDDTEATVRGMERQFANYVTGLLGNELHRAAGLGATAALLAARRDYTITEIWLTREDTLVCPVCEALHLTVTDLQPVTDTHPGCRCWKVPVPDQYEPTPLSYEEFLDTLET